VAVGRHLYPLTPLSGSLVAAVPEVVVLPVPAALLAV